MGYEKLLSFFTKNLSTNIVEDLYNKPIVVANHIYFDMNFILYNSIDIIETDINNINMLIISLQYTDIDIIQVKLKKIFNSYHWKKALENSDINIFDIMDGNNIDEIFINFNKILEKYVNNILYWNVYHNIINSVNMNHVIQFVQSINLFFDGIPTYAKILEQRRRRMKNYIDSKNRKKIFNQYFDNIIHNLVTEDDITFDYFDWLKRLYSFDKSLGPFSHIIIKLGDFLLKELQNYFNDIKITMNSSSEYGEADFKIFKHMKDNKIDGEVCIHSCDSDFIFMIIWYQILCDISMVDIKLMLITYNKNYSDKKTHEYNNSLIIAKKINDLLLEKYGNINNINSDININIIVDLLFIILMFGNDIIPSSYELGSELNLKILFESHYCLYCDNNFIININNINTINFNSLSIWLKNIISMKSFSIIILNRFYKLPYNIILQMTDKYDITDIVNKILIPCHINVIKNNTSDMFDEMDFRIKLINNIIKQEYDENVNQDNKIEKTSDSDINLTNYSDMMNVKDYGLIRNVWGYDLDVNPTQSLYNNIINIASNMTDNEFNRHSKVFFDNLLNASENYIELTKNCNVEEYLKLLINQSQLLFFNFDLYTPLSLFYYGDMLAPSIKMILNFIQLNNMNNIQINCYNIIKNQIKNCTNINLHYFNPISHHLFITPYLLESNYSDSIKEIDHVDILLNIIGTNINGIWYKENEKFILKNINPNAFIVLCNNLIYLYHDTIIKSSHNLLN